MASALGHELNQPLAAAMSDVQSAQRLLRKDSEAREKALGLLERSLECIERAAAIVKQHRQAIRPPDEGGQRIDLRESAEQICAMFEDDTRRRESAWRWFRLVCPAWYTGIAPSSNRSSPISCGMVSRP